MLAKRNLTLTKQMHGTNKCNFTNFTSNFFNLSNAGNCESVVNWLLKGGRVFLIGLHCFIEVQLCNMKSFIALDNMLCMFPTTYLSLCASDKNILRVLGRGGK